MRNVMKKCCAIAALALLCACKNAYISHNLERPVYLTKIEIRSDQITSEEPSHAVDPVFNSLRTGYTVVVPYGATSIIVSGVPEAGAVADYYPQYSFTADEQAKTITIAVHKEFRLSTTYTVHVIRGKPEALLSGIELYIGENEPAGDLNSYEDNNYIVNFVPERAGYEVKVPAYTNNAGFILRSPEVEERRVTRVQYQFLDWQGNVIGADGQSAVPGYYAEKNTGQLNKGPLPSWYPESTVKLGDIHVFQGGAPGSPAFFSSEFVIPSDPDPRGRGKIAKILITTFAASLDSKTYTIELQREQGMAYLNKLSVRQGPSDPVNRIIGGNFSPTTLNYEAGFPDTTAFTAYIAPVPDAHYTLESITYVPYYYDGLGKRYYVTGSHGGQTPGGYVFTASAPPPWSEHPVQSGDPPIASPPAEGHVEAVNPDLPERITAANLPRISAEFPFPIEYQRMEVVIIVRAVEGSYLERTYRVTIQRQKPLATLAGAWAGVHAGIEVYPWKTESGVTSRDVNKINPASFEIERANYDVTSEAGYTSAYLVLNNLELIPDSPPSHPYLGNALEGTAQRTITIITPDGTSVWHLSGGKQSEGGVWRNGDNVASNDPSWGMWGNESPWINVELRGRSTQVRIVVSDLPDWKAQTYVVSILSKNLNDIILLNTVEHGVLQSVFGSNTNVNAPQALPGERIRFIVEADLGYYIKNTRNDSGYTSGVRLTAAGMTIGAYIGQNADVRLISESGGAKPNQIKRRVYEFYMPDQNVQFEVDYVETVGAKDRIAYVASAAKRGGGYRSGPGQDTATSWGTASNDLQAVINSYTNGLFAEIWILKGTCEIPDPADYAVPVANETGTVFTSPSASSYTVPGVPLSGIAGRQDIAFIIRDNLPPVRGGFEEDHDDPDDRFLSPYVDTGSGKENVVYQAARKTVLSGAGIAHHVVIASGVRAAMDTLTISGAMGPQSDSSIGVNGRSVSRWSGGGMHVSNSEMALSNLLIQHNKTTLGGGMYVYSEGRRSQLDHVYFYSNTSLNQGGGMYNQAGGGRFDLAINNSRFEENRSVNQGGGMFIAGSNCEPEVRGTDFISNSALSGGGVYTAGGRTIFSRVLVEDNWTLNNGSGIYNANAAGTVSVFDNLTVRKNESKGGSGIGIYNAGTLHMTNAKITGNIRQSGNPSGGGLYNAGTALLASVTIEGNSADTGAGITNTNVLSLANVIIRNNNRVNGSPVPGDAGGLYNFCANGGNASAMLSNVTIAGNSGGGIYNDFEGVPDYGIAQGSLNVILTNVQITGNTGPVGDLNRPGAAVFNRYYRYSGRGIRLTLNNVTAVNNGGAAQKGAAVYTWKDTRFQGNTAVEDESGESDFAKRSFPVYMRIRNSVLYGNSSYNNYSSVSWGVGSNPSYAADFNPTPDRQVIEYSLVHNLPADPSSHTLSGLLNPALTSAFKPGGGSPLVNAGNSALYPAGTSAVLGQLFLADWKPGMGGAGSPDWLVMPVPVYISGIPLVNYREIGQFLRFDNSYNVGDLRDNGGNEGPMNKTRPGGLDIGAFEQ
ncbi:MAG: hypothetical protein LBK08_06925 [Treponema sp.]|jgi:hypothetical protein|nr:hypothetical protein [Treponema sp.]